MKYPNSFKLLITLLCFLALSSCNDDSDKDGVPDNKDKCAKTPEHIKVDTNGCPIQEPKISEIKFYFDNSLSNAGYYNGATQFKDIISDLVTKIEGEIKPIKQILFISDSITPYNSTTSDFVMGIGNTQADYPSKNGYPLNEMISQIVSNNKTNDISFFVSDCILSYPSDEIRKNRNINKEKRSTLKTQIYSTFNILKHKNFATCIYAFNSKFTGNYYYYNDTPKQLNGNIDRPFYVLVIGNKQLLEKKIDSLFTTKLSSKPEQYLKFGFSDETAISNFDILPQLGRIGEWSVDSKTHGIKNIEIKNGKPIQFHIALNLTNLPDYAKKIEYLKSKIGPIYIGCEASFDIKEKELFDDSKLKSQPQKEDFNNATHIVTITVNKMNSKNGSIKLSMPYEYDTWYTKWSVEDDKTMDLNKSTFAFDYFINGIIDAYKSNNRNFIDLSITLKQ